MFQRKTGMEICRPIDIRTCNYIYKYIRDARPKETGSCRLFLGVHAPYAPVSSNACRKAMLRAGASTGRTHLARKSFATAVLSSGATFIETADMLGHSDCSSVHKYTAMDQERMRLCPLSLAGTGLSIKGRYHHG